MNSKMGLLFEHARALKFEEFDSLFCEMEAEMPPEAFGEAYLMRAQIKLYAADSAILDDLEKASRINGKPQFPLLNMSWKSDGANRLCVIPVTPGALKAFLTALPRAYDVLFDRYGEQGAVMVRQIQCEINYFMGDIEAALELAEKQSRAGSGGHLDGIFALFMQYRCYLAQAHSKKAQRCMFDIIQCSKAYPECIDAYKAFRRWANLTTGWSGDSPRFYEDESGKEQPVLQDRLEGIRFGLAHDTPFEAPFVEYAKRSYEDAYTLRQYYMELFHAMYWLFMNDRKQAEGYFHKIYGVADASGVFMPMFECGEQIMPLLKHIRKCDAGLFLEDLMSRAAHYEEGLKHYRLTDG